MVTVLFDTNAYDFLGGSPSIRERVRSLVASDRMKVIVSRTVFEELLLSPFKGIPEYFPYVYVGNTVGRVDIMSVDDSIGDGEVFDLHLGNSTKLNDALVADAAEWHADWLVSGDTRLRKRANEQHLRCRAMSFQEFLEALDESFHEYSGV